MTINLKDHIYPTYQLHGFMANKKTAPVDGLRLGALIAIEWRRKRLGALCNPKPRPAGLGGQVNDQAAGLDVGQLLPAQHPGGDGVDDQVVAAQPAL